MSSLPIEDYRIDGSLMAELASEVALIINRQFSPEDIVKLFQIVFLDVERTASLLLVEPKTIRAWVSQEKIPYRKANGRVIFMLAELLQWTLPKDDRHTRHRLATSTACNITARKLAAAGKGVAECQSTKKSQNRMEVVLLHPSQRQALQGRDSRSANQVSGNGSRTPYP